MLNLLKSHFRERVRQRLGVPDVAYSFDRLAGQGFKPGLIFDVGAYEGEFIAVASRVWPDAKISCFEAQPAPLARLQAHVSVKSGRARIFPTLLGSVPDTIATLNLGDTASSVLAHSAGATHRSITAPMTTVDRVCATGHDGKAPDLLKLDVQGYELEVLKGAEAVLPGVSVILAELNLLPLYDGVPLMHEVCAWLAARGFLLYDIGQLIRRPSDRALWQIDGIFVAEKHPLRSSLAW